MLQVGQWVNQSQFSTGRSLLGRKVLFQEQYWQKRVKGGGAIDMAAPNDYQVQTGWQWGATTCVVLAEVLRKRPVTVECQVGRDGFMLGTG
ncbi:hypothetical protein METHP14_910021 [Pseudomonas sp. P14-2025]